MCQHAPYADKWNKLLLFVTFHLTLKSIEVYLTVNILRIQRNIRTKFKKMLSIIFLIHMQNFQYL